MIETHDDQMPDESVSRTISLAGLQVLQAADELAQAAQRLIQAQETVRECEVRRDAAEEQLAQGATKNAELLEMLKIAREGQTDAEERSQRAEQRLKDANERAEQAEQRLRDANERADQAEQRLRDANERVEQRLRDATEGSEQAERRLKDATERTRELEERVAELELRLEQADDEPGVTVVLNDERAALLDAVASEIRRPLTSILGLTLALRHSDPRSEGGTDLMHQLGAHARKLDRLVGEMLELDAIAAGTFRPNRRRTDLEALVRRVTNEVPDLHDRDVAIRTEHVAIEVDPALTEQMIETLLANAARRTVPGNPVWVTLEADGEGAVLSVDDTGLEIPEGLRAPMFAAASEERSRGRRAVKGATGLALLGRLAEIHGGRAWVEERPGGGASFRVSFSAHDARPPVPAEGVGGTDEVAFPSDTTYLPDALASGGRGDGVRDLSGGSSGGTGPRR